MGGEVVDGGGEGRACSLIGMPRALRTCSRAGCPSCSFEHGMPDLRNASHLTTWLEPETLSFVSC